MWPETITCHLFFRGLCIRLCFLYSLYFYGAVVGAGVELSALCARVVAARDTRFRLPELQMGLIPGVGGSWSIPRRIGRHRTLGRTAYVPVQAAADP